MKSPKITILTPSYNHGDYIEQNIISVLNQEYLDVEHIIIDGGSSDNTIDILKSYPNLRWISEKDYGQADALNKGLLKATGDIIGWLNSDDYYMPNIFTDVAKHFTDPNLNWIIGDIGVLHPNAKDIVISKSPKITYSKLCNSADIVKQPGVFIRRNFLFEIGGWDKQLYMVMDYDLWLRMSKISEPKMIHECFSVFRIHANQKTSSENVMRQLREIKFLSKREKAPMAYINKLLALYKGFIFSSIKQVIPSTFLRILKANNN